MSVVKSKQKPSARNFVSLSENIYKECLKLCIRMPRRYTNLVLSPIIELAGQITDDCHKANEIFLHEKTRRIDAERRHEYISKALENLSALSFRINIFLYMPDGISYHDQKTETDTGIIFKNVRLAAMLIDEEQRVLKGLLRHDKEIENKYNLLK